VSIEGVPCPLCGGTSTPAFTTTDRNRGLSDEPFHYRRCTSCGVLFLANVPEDLGRFYPGEYYSPPEELARAAQADSYKLDLIRPHASTGRLVEIGPGAGAFAFAASAAGFDVTAIEMDAGACEHLRAVVGVDAVQSSAPHEALASMPPSRAVAMWHVLEHLPQPWLCLESVAGNLEHGGVVAIAVPNADSLQLRLLGPRWPHVDAPRHLFLYPPALLLGRAAELGLELVELTATDPGSLVCNRFGWRAALVRPGMSRVRAGAAFAFGHVAHATIGPLERRGLRGSAFTAVFRKP
jgi:SAM-dependent methyltransferase